MRKAIKITISVVLAIVVLIAAVALVLGFIRVKPMDKFFGGYQRVSLYDLSQSEPIPDLGYIGTNEKTVQERLSETIENTSYSMLNGIISGKSDSSLRANTDSDGSARTLTAEQVLNLKATENSYMLVLNYDKDKTLAKGTIKGVDEDIVFDTLFMFISESPNEVVTVQVIPVNMDLVLSVSDDITDDNGNIVDSELYKAYDLRINMYAIKLYNSIKSIIDDYNTVK